MSAPDVRPDQGSPSRPDDRPRGTVLVVDDDPAMAKLVSTILGRAGHVVKVAKDAADARSLLSPEISLLLLDIMMPGESGPKLLAWMRNEAGVASLPVVFMTGRNDAETRIQCAAMGAVDFLAKPFRAADLLECVDRTLALGTADNAAHASQDSDAVDAILDAEDEPEPLPITAQGGSWIRTAWLRLLQEVRERRQTRQALAAHRRLIAVLFRLHQTLRAGPSRDAFGATILRLAEKALGSSAGELYVRGDGGGLDLLAAWPPRPGTPGRAASATKGASASSEAGADRALTRAPESSAPSAASGAAGSDLESGARRAWREWLSIEERDPKTQSLALHLPLTAAAERIGVLSLRFPVSREPARNLAGLFAVEIALALDAASRLDRVQNQAFTDALTGLRNRRFLETRFAEECRSASSLGASLSVLFIDIDHFKRVNDNLGHDVGDEVLCAIGALLVSELRLVDTVARWGGDEFVIVLPDTDGDAALAVARRLSGAMRRFASDPRPDVRALTLTIGLATYPQDATAPDELLNVADAALLNGKRAGRHRIIEGSATMANAAPQPQVTVDAATMLRTLLAALDRRDRYTGTHSRAVGALAARIARRMGCPAEEIRFAGQAGLMHDVGKLETPAEILRKPGPLERAERIIMDRHADLGAKLTEAVRPLAHLAPAVHACQEHYDGSGYPRGISGEAIPLAARIVAVADAYHAMSSDRPYRAALPRPAVVAELLRCSGTQFDPRIVGALLEVIGERQGAGEGSGRAAVEGGDPLASGAGATRGAGAATGAVRSA